MAHEDDETLSYSLRVAGLDLLSVSNDTSDRNSLTFDQNLMEREPAVTVGALSHSVNRIVSESLQARDSGNTEW